MEALIKLSSVLAEIKMLVPDEDLDEISGYDKWISVILNGYIAKAMTENQRGTYITRLEVSDGIAELPEGFKDVVQVVGRKDKEGQSFCKETWITELAGVMSKDGETDCQYSVIKNCKEGCPESECDKSMALITDGFRDAMASETNYRLYRSYWGYKKNDNSYSWSWCDKFKVMVPSLATIKKNPNCVIENSLCSLIRDEVQKDYEYELYDNKIHTAFSEGVIILTYRGYVYDEKGLLMFPQIESFIEAIKAKAIYETYRHLYRIHKKRAYRDLLEMEAQNFFLMDREAKSDLSYIGYHKMMRLLDKRRRKMPRFNFLDGVAYNQKDFFIELDRRISKF